MVAGNWLNYDGLYLQYGTTKAIVEAGGDYMVYGSTRELEVLVNLGATVYGVPTGNVPNPALPTLFNGVISTQTATSNTGIVSYTTLFPLQVTAPVSILASAGIYTASVGAANGILNLINPQMFIEQIEWVTLVPAGAGTGSATGITGIGLVIPVSPQSTPTAPSWAQITPNAGFQLLGLSAVNSNATPAMTINEMVPNGTVVPAKWIFTPGIATQQYVMAEAPSPTLTATATPGPYGGNWMGNVPLVTLSETYLPGSLPNNAYISAIASTSGTPGAAGTGFVGANGGGLGKLRVRYFWYGSINDANQI